VKRVWSLFAVSALILSGVLLARYHSPYFDGSRIKIESRVERQHKKIVSLPVCELEEPLKATKPFNIRRAYPNRALDRGVEGRVSALLRIDDQGKVVDVMIIDQKPTGVFDRAVEDVAMKMEYPIAEPACKGKLREADLDVEFKLFD
jgi:TonB family protein